MYPEQADVFTGAARRKASPRPAGKTLADFDVAPFVASAMGDDLQACRDAVKPGMALYIGGMGARGQELLQRLRQAAGLRGGAAKIQDLPVRPEGRSRRRRPRRLVDEVSLVGPERIKDRLQAWKEAGKKHDVGSMLLERRDRRSLRVVAEAVL